MRSMNFEQREAAIKGWFKTEIATRFTLPKDINPVNVATDVIESVNANIPSGVSQPYFDHILKEITKQVTRNARSRLLPVPKDFVDATRNASKSASAAACDENHGRGCRGASDGDLETKTNHLDGKFWGRCVGI